MKQLLIILLLTTMHFVTINAQKAGFYELKIYTLENTDQLQRMDNFLKQAFIPAMHRAGIAKVGVFKPIETTENTSRKIYVLTPLKSLDQLDKLATLLSADKQYQNDGKDYIDAGFDNPPYQRFESILLKAFKEMLETGVPNHLTKASERVYELRSYQGATEKYFQKKVHMFNEGGEVALFKELGFQPVFFGSVISGADMPNLMYLTTFESETSQSEHWNAFGKHPTWLAIKDLDQYKNTVSKMDKILLRPTEYSDL